jgi:hypothetical protein
VTTPKEFPKNSQRIPKEFSKNDLYIYLEILNIPAILNSSSEFEIPIFQYNYLQISCETAIACKLALGLLQKIIQLIAHLIQ